MFLLSRFPVYRGSVLGRFYCILNSAPACEKGRGMWIHILCKHRMNQAQCSNCATQLRFFDRYLYTSKVKAFPCVSDNIVLVALYVNAGNILCSCYVIAVSTIFTRIH